MNWLPNWLRKFLRMFPTYDSDNARLDGSNVFANDYSDLNKVKGLVNLYTNGDRPIYVRFPIFPNDIKLRNATYALMKNAQSVGIRPIALLPNLDNYNSESNMVNIIKEVSSLLPSVVYYEIFNEIPCCSGPEINNIIVDNNTLIEKINAYDAIVKKYVPKARTISMASVNVLGDMDLSDWGWKKEDGSNRYQQKLIAESTATDYTGIHLYCWNNGTKRGIWDLMDESWMKRKPVFVTECGADGADDHVSFYDEWTSRFVEYLNPEALIWYRQAIHEQSLPDNGFALECDTSDWKSDLYWKLSKK